MVSAPASPARRAAAKRLSGLLMAMASVSGCGVWREAPAPSSAIVPIGPDQQESARTIDVSYRFAGYGAVDRRLTATTFVPTVAGEFGQCGYALEETPWASRISDHAKLQVQVAEDGHFGMVLLCVVTLGLAPEIGDDHVTITVNAFSGQMARRYEERVLVKTRRWCPLLCFISPSYLAVRAEEQAGVREVVRTLVRRMREDGMIASPGQPAAP